MQQEAMKEIFKGICVEESQKDASEKRSRFEGEFFEQKGGQQPTIDLYARETTANPWDSV